MGGRGIVTRITAVLLAVAVLPPPAGARPAPGADRSCAMASSDRALLNRALKVWRSGASRLLGVRAPTVPWMVLVGSRCQWQLAPPPDRVEGFQRADVGIVWGGVSAEAWSRIHEGRVLLPGGGGVGVEPLASTSMADGNAFVLLSLPEVWRAHPAFGEADRRRIEEFWLGVFLHEVVHTEQLPWVAPRLQELGGAEAAPDDLDDDVIQRRFGDAPGYRAAMRRELRLLHRAASSPEAGASRAALREAVAAADARRAEHFTGDRSVFAELEEHFLALEGVASWTAYLLTLEERPGRMSRADLLARYQPLESPWIQAYGLLAYAVIDRYVTGWQSRSLGRAPESPFALLREALAASGEAPAPRE